MGSVGEVAIQIRSDECPCMELAADECPCMEKDEEEPKTENKEPKEISKDPETRRSCHNAAGADDPVITTRGIRPETFLTYATNTQFRVVRLVLASSFMLCIILALYKKQYVDAPDSYIVKPTQNVAWNFSIPPQTCAGVICADQDTLADVFVRTLFYTYNVDDDSKSQYFLSYPRCQLSCEPQGCHSNNHNQNPNSYSVIPDSSSDFSFTAMREVTVTQGAMSNTSISQRLNKTQNESPGLYK